MKAEQVSEHIWALTLRLPVIPLRVWLVLGSDGTTLVDAGLPMMAGPIRKLNERIGAGPLRRIVLTHGHADHVGAIRPLLAAEKAAEPVPVYVHRLELPHMQGESPYPGRRRAQVSLPPGVAQPLPERADGVLADIGGLVPYWTPGHAPGHVAYWHAEDRVLLAGDLFTSRRGQLRAPMAIFTADMATAIRSSGIVAELAPERLEVAHGGPVFQPAAQLREYWQSYGADEAS